jgi:preprotein translocase subunit SecG
MYSVILLLHIIICALLVIIVLLQQSRGGGMSSVFGGGGGGGGADSLFGGKGATPFFVKVTTGLTVGFFTTSLVLALLSRRPTPQSAVEKAMQEMPVPVPEEGGPIIPEEPAPIIPENPGGGE